MDLEASKKKVEALTAPRNVVLVGASDRREAGRRGCGATSTAIEFPGPIYLVNPRRTEIWDKPCYPDFQSLPEPPDHLVVLVPAAGVIETLRSGAAAGARSATVFSAGFGESFDTEAAALGRELSPVIEETGLGVSGPNCMGNVCAKSKLVTLTEDRPLTLQARPGRARRAKRRHDDLHQFGACRNAASPPNISSPAATKPDCRWRTTSRSSPTSRS